MSKRVGLVLLAVVLLLPSLARAAVEIVHGHISGDTTIIEGSGTFTVKKFLAGTGGTTLPGKVKVTADSAVVTAATGQNPSFTTQLTEGQFVKLGSGFFRVASIESNTQMTLTETYDGATVGDPGIAVRKNMRLFTEYKFTFTTPFLSTPAVVVSAAGNTPSANSGEEPTANILQLKSVTSNGFTVFLFQYPFGPYVPGGQNNIHFFARGSR
jgi:hypothetical protein